MSKSLVDQIWSDVADELGDALRVVTRYEGTGYDTRMRDDVRSIYNSEEDRAVVDDTIIKQLSLKETEDAFKTGQLHGLVRIFDDAWVLSWPDDLPQKSGVIISVQRNDTASMDELEWCIQYLNEEIQPQLA